MPRGPTPSGKNRRRLVQTRRTAPDVPKEGVPEAVRRNPKDAPLADYLERQGRSVSEFTDWAKQESEEARRLMEALRRDFQEQLKAEREAWSNADGLIETAIETQGQTLLDMGSTLEGHTGQLSEHSQSIIDQAFDIARARSDIEGAAAAILQERTERVSEDESLAAEIQVIVAATGENTAAILKERYTRTTELESLASTISTLSTEVGEHTSSISEFALALDGIYAGWGVKVQAGEAVGTINLETGEESSSFDLRANNITLGNGSKQIRLTDEGDLWLGDYRIVDGSIVESTPTGVGISSPVPGSIEVSFTPSTLWHYVQIQGEDDEKWRYQWASPGDGDVLFENLPYQHYRARVFYEGTGGQTSEAAEIGWEDAIYPSKAHSPVDFGAEFEDGKLVIFFTELDEPYFTHQHFPTATGIGDQETRTIPTSQMGWNAAKLRYEIRVDTRVSGDHWVKGWGLNHRSEHSEAVSVLVTATSGWRDDLDAAGDPTALTPAKKIRMREEMLAMMGMYADLQGTVTELGLQTSSEYAAAIDAYNDLGTYLNGGTAWVHGDGLPLWIRPEQMGTTHTIDPDELEGYVVARSTAWAALENLISREAAKTAYWTSISDPDGSLATMLDKLDTASDRASDSKTLIDDLSDDGKVTATEKKALRIEWDAIAAEAPDLVSTATDLGISSTAYSAALQALGDMLQGTENSDPWTPGDVPEELTGSAAWNTWALSDSGDTRSSFRDAWEDYYAARTALLTAMSTRVQELASADATTKANAAQSAAETYADNKFVDASLHAQDLADLQAQVDGNITSWFLDGVPTLSDAPASDWLTEAEREVHKGDLYYDETTGYAYRWRKNGGTWEWKLLENSDVTKALADAATAQDTADGKRRVFVTTPSGPYDEGDLWADGDVLRRATASRASGYVAGEWITLANHTTDEHIDDLAEAKAAAAQAAAISAAEADATAKAAQAKADALSEAAADAQAKADAAESAAESAANLYTNTIRQSLIDGEISTAEAAAINAAKADATTKANAAEAAAIAAAEADAAAKAAAAKSEAISAAATAAEAYADAAAEAAEITAKAYADGEITIAEQAAIDHANAKADLAETQAKAYADGIVDAEEARAIADAQAKADAAERRAKLASGGNLVPNGSGDRGWEEWGVNSGGGFVDRPGWDVEQDSGASCFAIRNAAQANEYLVSTHISELYAGETLETTFEARIASGGGADYDVHVRYRIENPVTLETGQWSYITSVGHRLQPGDLSAGYQTFRATITVPAGAKAGRMQIQALTPPTTGVIRIRNIQVRRLTAAEEITGQLVEGQIGEGAVSTGKIAQDGVSEVATVSHAGNIGVSLPFEWMGAFLYNYELNADDKISAYIRLVNAPFGGGSVLRVRLYHHWNPDSAESGPTGGTLLAEDDLYVPDEYATYTFNIRFDDLDLSPGSYNLYLACSSRSDLTQLVSESQLSIIKTKR